MKGLITLTVLIVILLISPNKHLNTEVIVKAKKLRRIELLTEAREKKENRLVIEEEQRMLCDLEEFLEKIAYCESRNKPQIVSKHGYLGKYQFGMRTIKGLGYNITKTIFLNNEELQDSVMIKYLRYNEKILKRAGVFKFVGKTIRGVKVSKGGILAGAHLMGAGGVIEFFYRKGKYKMSDANGLHISKRMNNFSEYTLDVI